MKVYTWKFNIIEYIMTSLLTVILSLSVFVGLNFKVDIVEVVSLTLAFVALLTIFLKRPQLVVTFLSTFILVDLYYFYMRKDVLTKVVLEIDKYVNWLYIYMSESSWPEGFNQLTNRYFFITVLLSVFLISLVITFLNRILKSYFLTMLFGIFVLVFQWYNYVDKAYAFLVFYVAASFINMSVINYQKAGNGKASIASLLAIAILFSSISTAIAYTVPKNFHPVVWQTLNDKFYAAFPFTKTWRNGIGSTSGANSFTTDFSSFSQDLGGPETVSDQVVMRVKADESLYLRGEVFDTYENNKWTNSVVQHSFGRDNYFQPEFDKNIKYTIKSVEIFPVAMNTNIIFSPWQPYHVNISNIYDRSTLAMTTAGRHVKSGYTVQYYKTEISASFLEKDKVVNSSDMSMYLQYPSNLPERVKELALNITKDKKTDYDKVKAIEQYLRNTYKYNLDVPDTPQGRDFVDYFLFDLKQGYCTYFATSMVIMLRTIGIPARYVVGFKMPSQPVLGSEYDIKESYAHAWVEVPFQNSGWVTFEPTAIYQETYAGASSVNNSDVSTVQQNNDSSTAPITKSNASQNSVQNKPVGSLSKNNTSNKDTHRMILFVALLLLLAIFAAIRYVLLKRHHSSRRSAFLYYYNKILKRLKRRGFKRYDSETTVEFQNRILDMGFSDFDKITKIYNDLVYGNIEPSEEDIVYIKEYLKKNMGHKKFSGSKPGDLIN